MQLIETYTDLPVESRTAYRIIVGNSPMNWVDPEGEAAQVLAAVPPIAILTLFTTAYLASPAGQKILEEIIEDIIEQAEKRNKEIEQCKTSTGDPSPPDPGKKLDPEDPNYPKDPWGKFKWYLFQLMRLINQHIKH